MLHFVLNLSVIPSALLSREKGKVQDLTEVDLLILMDPGASTDFQEVKRLLWGNQVRDELFRRWSQGFNFSADEPSALIQKDGGPCAIIAPVQAFLLRAILDDKQVLQNNIWRSLTPERVDIYLRRALVAILHQAATADENPPANSPSSSQSLKLQMLQQPQQQQSEQTSPAQPSPRPSSTPQYCLVFLSEPLVHRITSEPETENPIVDPSRKIQRSEQEIFHRNLRLLRLESIVQVENILREKLEALKGPYGIMQFLYSVILTRGIDRISNEMSEANELIDPVHGHGSQSLINLMLTGRGVSYVWDYEQDVGGLKLKGIEQQGEVGFLTLLERLRYCEVGSFLKNPKFPVWVVGSETHLTVLFSTNMDLVCPETPGETARRVFSSFDPEGNNFISSVLLEDVMRTLGLYADPEYVELMKKRLDPETLGIILMNTFMDEFFPNEKSSGPITFTLYHYNGLQRASSTEKVIYQEGNAILLESDLRSLSDDNMILTCLQTKWPSIDVQWQSGLIPSIN
ncbi:unnamed protein product [Allacma fusca]|uniref:Ubiquitin carboxyl-terminal hydrolase MINDY n=1 Tax=Allacma fusca TaxID=39272 RepID=A0A8J2P8C0_9HEXA|nr:unnamed protein product [Allacma fusca]